ncbi:hypothetical protein GT037_000078, partial [Alternaria burnsii]
VALKSPFGGKAAVEISVTTGVSPRTIDSIYQRACQRGFDPHAAALELLPKYLEDAPRTGRPRKQERIQEEIIQKVRRNRYGREKSCADIAAELCQLGHQVSPNPVWRILKASGYKKT